MSVEPVRVHPDGAVAHVVLNDPARRNPLNADTLSALIDAFRTLDGDSAVRAIVLRGEGDHFSAGADLRELAAELGGDAVQHWDAGAPWEELFTLVPLMGTPVIAAVRGYALGGGCGLVALCDVAIAAADARLGMTEINVGFFPLVVLPALRRAVGERRARELALTGTIVDGLEAERIGLVSRAVPGDRVEATAKEVALAVAGRNPDSMRLGKQVLAATQDMTYPQAVAYARSLRVTYLMSDGLREGVDAFLHKRKPSW